jgi:hypothetical protein
MASRDAFSRSAMLALYRKVLKLHKSVLPKVLVCQRSAPVYAAFASSKPHVPVRRDLQSRLQRTGLVRAPALQCLNHCCCWFLKMARLLVKRNAAVSRVAPTRFFA